MAVLNSLEEHLRVGLHHALGEWAVRTSNEDREVRVDELKDKHGLLRRGTLKHIIELHNIRMIEALQRLKLSHGVARCTAVRIQARDENALESHDLLCHHALRLVHLPEGALPNLLDDSITS